MISTESFKESGGDWKSSDYMWQSLLDHIYITLICTRWLVWISKHHCGREYHSDKW